MKTIEKIKWLNKGMALQREFGKPDNKKENQCSNCYCYEAFKEMLAEEKRIYCGIEDYVEFFKNIISTLGLDEWIEYRVEDVDGELEIVIGGNV